MFELEAVINVEYGGFSLSDEMALWLVENKNWKRAEDLTNLTDNLSGVFRSNNLNNSKQFKILIMVI
jgi:hypothetical protein